MKRVLAGLGTTLLTASVVTVLAPAQHAVAATLSVPGQYRTISAAIAAAHNGDTILVSPGTYRENITISGKNLVLRTVSGPDKTIIAGNPGRSPVMFQHVGPSTVIRGFRIVSGNAPSGQGGGITVANGASPVIAYNKILSNRSNDGGGILVYNQSNPDIAYNYIENNTASQFGGGVFAYIGSNPVLHDNVISGNRATGGGGIYLESNSGNRAARAGGKVVRNTITGNIAAEAGGGIMMRTGEVAQIDFNVISGNRAPYGGGIEVETNGSGPSIVGNQIKYNTAATSSAYPGSGSGGGIAVYGQSTPLIQGNTVYGNRSSIYGGGIVLAEGSNSRVVGNNIAANVVVNTTPGVGGGGLFGANSDCSIWNNVFRANSARGGGGLSFSGTGNWVILNNTIVSNRATGGGTGALGGGLFVGGKTTGKTSVVNNIFADNNNFQIFDSGRLSSYANNLADINDLGPFYSYATNKLTALSQLNGRYFYGSGNVDGNSAFVNGPGANYMLTAGSNAVDHGRAAGAPGNDYRGARRPYGRGYDIGAYEYTG